LGEDTGLLITNNNEMEAIGSGLVILVDGRYKKTQHYSGSISKPISINNLVVHVMSMNDTYDIGTHKMQIHNINKV
jgi:cyanophycinase